MYCKGSVVFSSLVTSWAPQGGSYSNLLRTVGLGVQHGLHPGRLDPSAGWAVGRSYADVRSLGEIKWNCAPKWFSWLGEYFFHDFSISTRLYAFITLGGWWCFNVFWLPVTSLNRSCSLQATSTSLADRLGSPSSLDVCQDGIVMGLPDVSDDHILQPLGPMFCTPSPWGDIFKGCHCLDSGVCTWEHMFSYSWRMLDIISLQHPKIVNSSF